MISVYDRNIQEELKGANNKYVIWKEQCLL